ncbi:NUDIX domain-containing protein [Candidatus Fermentibacteria bacterium]|nr:NUDIX domain-containing protein [Candidatus Fermentibacteria bacterium]
MEKVLVVSRGLLFQGNDFHGFIPLDEAPGRGATWLDSIRLHAHFASRAEVETDPGYKQIIPYAVLLRGDEMLLFQRLSGGGERRLHRMLSVGVGGHINSGDEGQGEDRLMAGARRELLEEVSIDHGNMGIVGFVNDDTNPVGSVHFGVVFRVDVGGASPVSREPSQLDARMHPLQDVLSRFVADPGAFETWSSLVLSAWDRLVRVTPVLAMPVP